MSTTPSRIRLSEALEHLKPLMKKSKFYGTRAHPGPRRLLVVALDIREGPPITLDRKKFFDWMNELTGDLAHR